MQQTLVRQSLLDEVSLRLTESPAVVLLGARQVGKTTLAGQVARHLGGATVFDLERASGRAALAATPELTLADAEGLVVIDEVQRMPALFETLRPLCDDPGRKSNFLLLGSAAPDLVRGVSESLAGRIQFVPVPGFSLSEVGQDEQDRLWLRGGFPRAYLAGSDAAAARWMEGFRRTFLERDIPGLGLRVPSAALDRFWAMLSHYHGQTWNAAELGRAMSMSPGTANHYRDLLADTFMLRVLQPWHENLGKRQVKAPKVYFRDSGMLHHFLGVGTLSELRAHPRYGASWEGFALEQTMIRFGEGNAWFWATQRGAELDLMLLRGGRRWGFEYKCADAPSTSKSMHIAVNDLGLAHLWVVYPGRDRYPLGDRITALPLRDMPRLVLDAMPNAEASKP
ncbi:MAG: ATP-binding protein [Candidatus Nitricoxidivorans perseverans]|uniref:ATP-binding protein n=1 Tax=Candidatus Nitricoxidivorans perseverans TaxID=2975601 RepID=A0AA49FKB8_9PROT|nr:MAG: ATP-binding protein [Candidatus Nitricoxidivorans perseverans]